MASAREEDESMPELGHGEEADGASRRLGHGWQKEVDVEEGAESALVPRMIEALAGR